MGNKPLETITDEQGRQWILQKLHDEGFKYLYYDRYFDNEIKASELPPKVNYSGVLSTNADSKNSDCIFLDEFITINKPYIDIEKELGIVDWNKVPVDAPIVVWNGEGILKHNRYFAKYEDGVVYTFKGGTTSWSTKEVNLSGWSNAQLANVCSPADFYTQTSSSDNIEEHNNAIVKEPAEKLEAGKWYNAPTFDEEELKELLEIGTLIEVLVDDNKDIRKTEPDKEDIVLRGELQEVGQYLSTHIKLKNCKSIKYWFKIID